MRLNPKKIRKSDFWIIINSIDIPIVIFDIFNKLRIIIWGV